MFTHRLLVDYQ